MEALSAFQTQHATHGNETGRRLSVKDPFYELLCLCLPSNKQSLLERPLPRYDPLPTHVCLDPPNRVLNIACLFSPYITSSLKSPRTQTTVSLMCSCQIQISANRHRNTLLCSGCPVSCISFHQHTTYEQTPAWSMLSPFGHQCRHRRNPGLPGQPPPPQGPPKTKKDTQNVPKHAVPADLQHLDAPLSAVVGQSPSAQEHRHPCSQIVCRKALGSSRLLSTLLAGAPLTPGILWGIVSAILGGVLWVILWLLGGGCSLDHTFEDSFLLLGVFLGKRIPKSTAVAASATLDPLFCLWHINSLCRCRRIKTRCGCKLTGGTSDMSSTHHSSSHAFSRSNRSKASQSVKYCFVTCCRAVGGSMEPQRRGKPLLGVLCAVALLLWTPSVGVWGWPNWCLLSVTAVHQSGVGGYVCATRPQPPSWATSLSLSAQLPSL